MATAKRNFDWLQHCTLLSGCLCAVALSVFGGASSAVASLVGPDAPSFSLEAYSVGTAALESPEATATPSNRDDVVESRLELMLIDIQYCHNSTTSHSGPPSPTWAGAAVAFACAPSNMPYSSHITGWVSGERQVALPSPPANELLRPPQAS